MTDQTVQPLISNLMDLTSQRIVHNVSPAAHKQEQQEMRCLVVSIA